MSHYHAREEVLEAIRARWPEWPDERVREVCCHFRNRHNLRPKMLLEPPRYWMSDGKIDWKFLNRCVCGVLRQQTLEETLVAHAYGTSDKRGVLQLLAEWGEIEYGEDPGAIQAAQDFAACCRDRRRRHSLWGRGRKTASATI